MKTIRTPRKTPPPRPPSPQRRGGSCLAPASPLRGGGPGGRGLSRLWRWLAALLLASGLIGRDGWPDRPADTRGSLFHSRGLARLIADEAALRHNLEASPAWPWIIGLEARQLTRPTVRALAASPHLRWLAHLDLSGSPLPATAV